MATEARFGISKFGVTKFGDVNPNPKVYLAGTDRSSSVSRTLTIPQTRSSSQNDITLNIEPGVVPVAGQSVIVALCSAVDAMPQFTGTIISVTQHQQAAGEPVFYEATAADETWLMDRLFVTGTYVGVPIECIVAELVRQAASTVSSIKATFIQSGLGNVDFSVTNVRLSAALSQLAGLVNASWYYCNGLHFFTDETSRYPNPASLTDATTTTFEAFTATRDLTQVRTRAIVETPTVTSLLAWSAGSTITELPVTADNLSLLPVAVPVTCRIGSLIVTFDSWFGSPTTTTTLTSDVAAGATSISVASTGAFVQAGWLSLGNNIIRCTGLGGGTAFTGIPATGVGSITEAAKSGDLVAYRPWFIYSAGLFLSEDIKVGAQVIRRTVVNDTAAQTALAALEGGDGIHEILISMPTATLTAASARATAELVSPMNGAVTSVNYDCYDTETMPGRSVTVSLTGTTAVSGTFRIQNVTRDFLPVSPTSTSRRKFPRCRVSAIPVALGGVGDLVTVGEDSQ